MTSRDPGLAQQAKDDIIERNGRDLTWLAVATGVVIVACHLESGARRWSAAIWETALKVPGAPATWGLFILAAGILMWAGSKRDTVKARRLYRLGAKASSAWFSCVAFFWGLAVITDLITHYAEGVPGSGVANPFGIPMCVYVAVMMGRRAHMANEQHYG